MSDSHDRTEKSDDAKAKVSVDREQRSFSDWPFLVKLDLWGLVRPRDSSWLFITPKARRRGSRALAVRQAAVFTYELLGGEKKRRVLSSAGLSL